MTHSNHSPVPSRSVGSCRRVTTAVLAAVLMMAGLIAGAPTADASVRSAGARDAGAKGVGPTWVEGSLVVRVRGAADDVLRSHNMRARSHVGGGWVEVSTGGLDVAAAGRALRADARVLAAEPNYIRKAFLTTNDPSLGSQTAMHASRFKEAWDVQAGAPSVRVAVLDTGVDLNHADLVDQLDSGYDFVDNDTVPADANAQSHGTMTAGIIGAEANNGIGIAGAAYNTRILPVRVLDSTGAGSDSNIAAGIRWAADNDAKVISISLGGPGVSTLLDDAIAYAHSKDVVVVASTGNHGSSEPMYPANAPGVIGVGAVDGSLRNAYFSGHGTSVDITAVGVGVWSTMKGNTYGSNTGTSFSAPLVAAAAALVRAANPSMTSAEVATRLYDTARDAGPSGRDNFYGHGILDAFAALNQLMKQQAIAPAAGDAREPDGSGSGATTFSSGVQATIAPEGDVDLFAIELPGPGTLTATVSPPSPQAGFDWQGLDAMVALLAPNSSFLDGVDQKGMDESETLTTSVPGAGRYLIGVANYHGTISAGAYTLYASFSPAPPPPPPPPPPAPRSGYWMVDAGGAVYGFGNAAWMGNVPLGSIEAVDLEPTPSGNGYWIVDTLGRVFAFGDARWLGQIASGLAAGERVTSLSRTPSGNGYWLFTTLGRVATFGDAPHVGDMAGVRLNGPVLDSIPTRSGRGYFMVASDGGIFAFGDAVFRGSMGATRLNAPVQSLVPDADGIGYWLVASDGGIFAFDAPFYGSMGSVRLNRPVTGMVGFRNGYLMVGEDGGIFSFGDAPYHGSLGDRPPARPVTSVAPLVD